MHAPPTFPSRSSRCSRTRTARCNTCSCGESAGQNGQHGLAGKTLTLTRDGRTKTFTFPADLPSVNTANRSVLIVTPGYLEVPARYPEYKAVTPDYVAFDQLLPAEGGTIDFAGADQWTFGPLPRDGFSAMLPHGQRRARQRRAELRRRGGQPSRRAGNCVRVLSTRRSTITSSPTWRPTSRRSTRRESPGGRAPANRSRCGRSRWAS